MNEFLANAVGAVNAVLAVIIVITSTIAAGMGPFGFDVFTALLGMFVGVIVAIAICGVLALLIQMRRELMQIRAQLERR